MPAAPLIEDDYHLVIPHNLAYEPYKQFYTTTLRKLRPKSYVILDNGAAEGLTRPWKELKAIASEVHASQIVVPDVIGDAIGTMDAVQKFEEEAHPYAYKDLKFMGVVQGNDPSELFGMLRFYANRRWVDTIGIPRCLIEKMGLKARCGVIKGIEETYGRTKWSVHLLGAHASWPVEVAEVAKLYPWVRGIDTSMAFNYARYGVEISNRQHITRPPDFNTYPWDADDIALATNNIRRFREWAR